MRHLLRPAILAVVLFFLSLPAAAQESAALKAGLRGRLGVLDWFVVAAYILAMLYIGFYYSRRAKTSEEYYLGGRRMKPFMVGVSLFATMVSTISYLAVPGEVMKNGPMAAAYVFCIPIVFVIVGYGIIPFIMRLPITSAYEILEGKFGKPVRLFGSCIFLLIRLVWMGLVVYSASKVVIPCLGWNLDTLPYVLIFVGGITIAYASMGGLQAVILTDVIQAFILFGGAFVCIAIVTVKLGGFGWIPTQWSPNWDVQPWFSTDPTVRMTLFGTMIQSIAWWVCTAGSDQMAIQRYVATRNAKAARRAFLFNNLADVLVEVLLVCLGFALLAFYMANPEFQIGSVNLEQDADYLFPHFVVNFTGFGIAGLVISGMLAAAMSSLASGVTSTATVLNTDILTLLLGRALTEREKVRLGKWVTVAVGVIVIGLGLLMDKIPGNLYELTAKTNGLFVAPLFGLFFMAMFVPFATPMGTVFGTLYGILAAFLIAFWDLTGHPAISFQWIIPGAMVVNIVVGCLFSLVPTRGKGVTIRVLAATVFTAPLVAGTAAFVAACIAH